VSNDASSHASTPLQIARRVLAREMTSGNEREPERFSAALQRAWLPVIVALRDTMGEDGCNALLARALARAEAGHPTLETMRRVNGSSVHLEGITAGVESHGVSAVAAANEALLAALVEILVRLIGEDMVMRLIDPDAPTGGGVPAS
jgi:hypothetical protein